MNEKSKVPGCELFEQAAKNYEQALHAGFKLQHEAAKCWVDLVANGGSAQGWQAKFNQAATESLGAAQKRIEENLKLVEQSSRASLDLLKKAVEVAQAETVSASQSKIQEVWEASLSALRTNAAAITQANSKLLDSWIQFIPKVNPAEAGWAAA